ncbi:MAG TPA: rhomboid family intramembrane serine protease [Candidatus Eremiobacteraceae bacterium]|nr:rhomboid family intramembrane serine protease [Candidatus Eremiobacteraceae bacterium]
MSLRYAPVTIALVVINILVYGADQLSPQYGDSGVHRLMFLGAIIPELVARGEYYRIVTAGFLQFNLQHIAFNMYAMTQAGMVVENIWGSGRFAIIYFSALIAGGIAAYESTIHTADITAGASGAIMGLFGAIFALGLRVPRLRRTLVGWALFPILATLAVGFTQPGISNAGHIGGVIAGAIVGFALPATRLRKDDVEESA